MNYFMPLFQKTPSETKYFLVLLEIQNINDNPPIFVNAPYTASVDEVRYIYVITDIISMQRLKMIKLSDMFLKYPKYSKIYL